MKSLQFSILLLFTLCMSGYSAIGGTRGSRPYTYAVVINSATYNDPKWKAVADTLLSIHGKTESKLIKWDINVTEAKTKLKEFQPDYIAFVCTPAYDISVRNAVFINKMVRELDSDPYLDAVYGVVTGFNANDALRAVTDTLRIKTALHAAAGGEAELNITTGAVNARPVITYQAKGINEEKVEDVGEDRTLFLAKCLNEGVNVTLGGKTFDVPIDAFGTGGHGLYHSWQVHYPNPDKEGYFRSSNGQLIADPHSGDKVKITKTTPTVYWAVNNCEIGNPDLKNNFVYSWFHTGRAVFMFGFMPLTFASHSGTACMKRAQTMAGINPCEAYFLGQNNLVWARETKNIDPKWLKAAAYPLNLDSTIVYGDPKADVLYKEGDGLSFISGGLEITLTNTADRVEGFQLFELKTTKVVDTLRPWSAWKRDLRPVVPLPFRIDISTVEVLLDETFGFKVVDNVVLVDAWKASDNLPSKTPKGTERTLKFRAKPLNSNSVSTLEGVVNKNSNVHELKLTNSSLTFKTNVELEGELKISVIDAKGRIVLSQNKNLGAKTDYVQFNLEKNISPGAYLVRIQGPNMHLTHKLILK